MVHKVQTYRVIKNEDDPLYAKKLLKEKYPGFSLSVDLIHTNEEQIIASLKTALEQIEKELNDIF